jgi:ABC-type polysaccharide/polyol phosphate export permease
VKKVPFPAAVLPMATIANNLIHFLLSIPVLVAFLLLAGRTPGWEWLIGVPALLGVTVALMVGCALFLSAVDVFFRDLEHLIEVLLTLLFYVTPVLYPLASVPQPYRDLFRLNPIVPLIDAWRRLFLDNELPGLDFLPGLVMTALILVLGAWVFSKLRPVFADHL